MWLDIIYNVSAFILYCTIMVMNWYCIKQKNSDWNLYCLWFLVTVIIMVHCTIFGAQSSYTQKQADQSSILLSCICNWCNINAKLLNIIFVVDVAVSSESEFHECNVAHISETLLFWQSVHNCERERDQAKLWPIFR